MNAEQANQIFNLESFCKVTGAKRFKRTKEEMTLGLSPEEALKRRLAAASSGSLALTGGTPPLAPSIDTNGVFTITIVPEVGVDRDYLERVPTTNITVRLDDKWFMWYDELLTQRYEGDVAQLLQAILDQGMHEVINPV